MLESHVALDIEFYKVFNQNSFKFLFTINNEIREQGDSKQSNNKVSDFVFLDIIKKGADVCAFCKPYLLGFSFAFIASFVLGSDANVTNKHKKVSVNENTVVNAYDELYVNTTSVFSAACFENSSNLTVVS
nr:hypothetical protein [Tanacetum cinerariifolium]